MNISGVGTTAVKSYQDTLRRAVFGRKSAKPRNVNKPRLNDHIGLIIDIYV